MPGMHNSSAIMGGASWAGLLQPLLGPGIHGVKKGGKQVLNMRLGGKGLQYHFTRKLGKIAAARGCHFFEEARNP